MGVIEKVCIIEAKPHVGRCGIYDYTQKLGSALSALGVSVEHINNDDWSLLGTLKCLQRVRKSEACVLHIQYPLIFGWRSLGLHLIGILTNKKTVVTLHEFSSFGLYHKMAIALFLLSAKIFVTNDYERRQLLKTYPFIRSKVDVVPIGSNIKPAERKIDDAVKIIHFGQIKPDRGIEQFLALSELARKNDKPWEFHVVGAPVEWAKDFLALIEARYSQHNVKFYINLSDDVVSDLLSETTIAYLPYPDGASERRGSLIAIMAAGVPVITTSGDSTPADMGDFVIFAADHLSAYSEIDLLLQKPKRMSMMSEMGVAYSSRFDWSSIADKHLQVYKTLSC